MNFPHKGQWRRRGTWLFSLICAWTNDWVNNRNAGNLRRPHAHNGLIVMMGHTIYCVNFKKCVMFTTISWRASIYRYHLVITQKLFSDESLGISSIDFINNRLEIFTSNYHLIFIMTFNLIPFRITKPLWLEPTQRASSAELYFRCCWLKQIISNITLPNIYISYDFSPRYVYTFIKTW